MNEPMWVEALELAEEKRVISIAILQRNLRVGYNRAAVIFGAMEEKGILLPFDGTFMPRSVDMKRLSVAKTECRSI